MAGVLGPTVTAPLGGVEPAQAAAALTSAVTLNEALNVLTPSFINILTYTTYIICFLYNSIYLYYNSIYIL